MKRFVRYVSYGVLAVFINSSAHADPPPSAPKDPLTMAIDAVIDKNLSENRVMGAVVLVAYNGELIYHRAAGYADREAKKPMQENAIFRLSSVSKLYTTLAAAALIEKKRMKLDDPVSKYLPDFVPAMPNGDKPVITVRQLMTHTAGLDYGFFEKSDGPYIKAGVSDGLDDVKITLDENIKRIASAPLLYQPGTSWRYSLATDVLGAVVAKVHGAPLPQAVRDLVTDPLNMDDTGFDVADRNRLVTPYFYADQQQKRMGDEESIPLGDLGDGVLRFSPGRALDSDAYPSGGAGMVGTASDVMQLLEILRNGGVPVIGPELVDTMMSNQIGDLRSSPGVGFGYGWGVVVEPDVAKSPQSPGTIEWFGVYGHAWFVDPARKLTVVTLSNTALDRTISIGVRDAVYQHLSNYQWNP